MKIFEQTLLPIAQVSTVIPCFRNAKTIERAITSVAQQTQKPAEIILIDDASDDDTLIILQNLIIQYPDWIKVIGLPKNQGAANARNVGWAAATQPYIAFLDADDAWHPKKIEIQYAYMTAHPEIVLSGHRHRIIDDKFNLPDWSVEDWKEINIPKWSWLLSNKFVTPSVMVRRDAYHRFEKNQRYMEDYRLWLALVFSDNRVTKLSADLVAIYKSPFGSSGLSAQLWPMEQGELNNYKNLYQKNYINLAAYLGLSFYSLLKFVRRLMIYWGWLRWKT